VPHWLLAYAGLTSPNSPWYLFWSGIGADWTRLLAIGGLLKFSQTLKRHHSERVEQTERHHRERMGQNARH
jgi:hypothetical protein